MILKTLVDLAKREGLVDDPDYEPKPVRWVVSLGTGGKFLGVAPNEVIDDRTKKPKPGVMQVPRSAVRTSGSAAAFLVDKAEYALGFDPDGNPKKVNKLSLHNRLFAEHIEAALKLTSEELGLMALLAFLRNDDGKALCIADIGDRAVGNDLFAFAYLPDDGSPGSRIHDRDRVREAWRQLRGAAGKADSDFTACLVCGQIAGPVHVHTQVKRIPGGSTSGIALVSFNSPAFESLGLERNDNAPVCQSCAEAYGTALNRLFHPQYSDPNGRILGRRSIRISDNTAVVYWASDQHKIEDEFGDLDFADAANAGHLFDSVQKGKSYDLDPTHFHALIVTGGQGRATIRGYHQTTVDALAANLDQYFKDVDIVPRFPNAPRQMALKWLIRSLAAQGEDKNVDPNLAGQFFLAILTGSVFPAAILQVALKRIRSEPENPDRRQFKHTRERLALIRASLNRRFRANDRAITELITQEVSTVLDPNCNNNGYCLGRLFAVLEKLQGEAIGSPGATITDRFYGSASATPVAVFGTLIRKAQHHLGKVQGPFYARKLQEVLDLLRPENAFPPTLSLEEQGLFALGYYHQKADLWKGKDKPEAPVAAVEPAVTE
jgi:CRISPR-associated protein Csd1